MHHQSLGLNTYRLPQHFFEFGEGHLDPIEIGAVGFQEQKACTGTSDEARRLFVLMARQIVEDHSVALAQNGGENLLDIVRKHSALIGPSSKKGAISASQLRPARSVVVFQ
jgi:hypothetical protein